MSATARRAVVLLTDRRNRVIEVSPAAIGLIMPMPWGCQLWSPDLKSCVRVRETLQQVLQAIHFAPTITVP